MTDKGHALFSAHPLSGTIEVTEGEFPVPYHVYDGHGLILGGTCDPAALDFSFTGQDVYPVLTESGQGLAVLFVCDFPHASHGPHREVHFAALACATANQSLPDDPAALFAAIGTRQDWGVLSLHLWNDDPGVVAYNHEFLGLNAHLAYGEIDLAHRFSFSFTDQAGAPLVSGDVSHNRRSDSGFMFRVMRHMGLRGTFNAARTRHAEAYVINRKGPYMSRNLKARTLTAPDKMVVSQFRPDQDRLEMQHPILEQYSFQPTCLEHISPFRFIYFPPDSKA